MHESHERLANLLGAAALTLTDRFIAAATRRGPAGASAAAALVTLSAHEGIGITDLGQRIGLSQPATARMVQGLESAGLVRRRPSGDDHRSRELLLTDDGRARVRELLDARARALTELLGDVSAEEADALAGVLEKVLRRATLAPTLADHLCRLCDRPACVTGGAACPVTAAAYERPDA